MFDGFRAALAANRAGFFIAVPSGPFYGFNRDGIELSQPVVDNWVRQGTTGSALAHYEGMRAQRDTRRPFLDRHHDEQCQSISGRRDTHVAVDQMTERSDR